MTGQLTPSERLADMANVASSHGGDPRLQRHPFMQHWHPADCPSEIVGDLLNALDDARGDAS